MYTELDKSLSEIRKMKREPISIYERWMKSKRVIDEYYSRDDINADDMYERLNKLKIKIRINDLIILPIFIGYLFMIMGFSLTWIVYFFNERNESLNGIIIAIIVLTCLISFTVFFILYFINKINIYKQDIYEYEIDKIEELINLPENKQIINKIKNIPTEEKQNE